MEAIEQDPKHSPTYLNLGFAYEAARRDDEAIKAYRKAVEIAPSNASALYRLGKLYYRLDRKEEALEAFKQFMVIDPDVPQRKEVMKLMGKIESSL